VASNIGLVLSFEYAQIDPPRADGAHNPRAAIPFFVLCLSFYIHGYFGQRWEEGSAVVQGQLSSWWLMLHKLLLAFVMLLIVMTSTPLGDVETGHYIYPIYSASYEGGAGFGAVYVLGTWAYIGVFTALFRAYCDEIGSPALYKHATGSTMVVYIFHWVFVKIFAFWWLNPTLWRYSWIVRNAWVALAVTLLALVVSVALSLSIYWLLLKTAKLAELFGLEGSRIGASGSSSSSSS